MAKCLRNPRTEEVVRVSNEEADQLARKGWTYIGKMEFRRMADAPAKATAEARKIRL